MGKSCCAIGCKNRFDKKSALSFYRLPKAEEKRRRWLAAIRRSSWNPEAEAWICGCHFVSGKKSDDPLHPDYVPSLFSFTSSADHARAVGDLERYLRSQEVCVKRELAATVLLDLQQSPALKEEAQAVEVHGTEVQTEETHGDIASLHAQIKSLNMECQSLREKVYRLESELKLHTLDPSHFEDGKMRFFTGLPNLQAFMLVFSYVSSVLPAAAKQSLKPAQELLLTLMKLRLNLSEEFLGHLFGIHQSTVSRIFHRWIHVMASRLHPLILWPDREELRRSLPVCFQAALKNCVSIVDCFEVSIERPSDLQVRAETWSPCKQRSTLKFLVSVTPQGSISFVSKAWGGCVTDTHLAEHSGFLDKLRPGDLILADRAFAAEDSSVGLFCAELVTPPLAGGERQLCRIEVESAPEISCVRTYVKRVTAMLRHRFRILGSILPVGLIRVGERGRMEDGLIDEIVFACCALCNLCEATVPSD